MRTPSHVIIALAMLALAAPAAAQGGVTIDGNVKVGRLGAPNMRLEVLLSTAIGAEVSRGYTTEEGKFRFTNINPGDYTVLVKAPYKGPYKNGSADLRIPERRGGQNVSVTVIVDVADPTPTEAAKNRTVSADETQASIPRQAKKLYESGTKAAAAGRTEEAVSYFRRALEIAPDYLFALNDLGAKLLELDRLDESVQVLRKAVAVSPRSYSPRMNLSLALLFSKKPAEAQTEIAAALAERPDEANALYVSGQIEWALGNREQALAAFDRALLSSNGQLVSALIQLGKLHEEMGNPKSAREMYRTYLNAAADGPSAAFARERLAAIDAQP
jgi:tetratricopeptide (TPR) repeat protein